jgi:hypothetical protein
LAANNEESIAGTTELKVTVKANTQTVSVYALIGGGLPTADQYTASWRLPAAVSVTLDLASALRPFVLAHHQGTGSAGLFAAVPVVVGVTSTAVGYAYSAATANYSIISATLQL